LLRLLLLHHHLRVLHHHHHLLLRLLLRLHHAWLNCYCYCPRHLPSSNLHRNRNALLL
jgi:hypothetical protein